jgi:hypothetical protein
MDGTSPLPTPRAKHGTMCDCKSSGQFRPGDLLTIHVDIRSVKRPKLTINLHYKHKYKAENN